MGGAPCCEGNVTPAAEYNIWVDPEAARAVFRSKLNIEMIGWHVSRGASVLRDDEIAAIEALGTVKAKFAIELNTTAREAYRTQTGEIGLSLADPTAMVCRAGPLDWPLLVASSGRDRDREQAHPRHDRRGPPECATMTNNAHVWREANGEHEDADVLWPRLAPLQGYAEGGACVAAPGSCSRANSPSRDGRPFGRPMERGRRDQRGLNKQGNAHGVRPQSPRGRVLALSAAARRQSRALAALGSRRSRPRRRRATARSCSRSAMPPAIGAT